jgi:hypothetical protein
MIWNKAKTNVWQLALKEGRSKALSFQTVSNPRVLGNRASKVTAWRRIENEMNFFYLKKIMQ